MTCKVGDIVKHNNSGKIFEVSSILMDKMFGRHIFVVESLCGLYKISSNIDLFLLEYDINPIYNTQLWCALNEH